MKLAKHENALQRFFGINACDLLLIIKILRVSYMLADPYACLQFEIIPYGRINYDLR